MDAHSPPTVRICVKKKQGAGSAGFGYPDETSVGSAEFEYPDETGVVAPHTALLEDFEDAGSSLREEGRFFLAQEQTPVAVHLQPWEMER